jgi:ABC-2 type transport system ATP-binding protein
MTSLTTSVETVQPQVTPGELFQPDPAVAVSMRSLVKVYGSVRALDGLDLDIPANSIYGVIGPNGAGKTTMMSIVATLLKPTSGYIRVLGHDPGEHADEVRKIMGYMPDVMGVNERLTVSEYLTFYAHVYKHPKSQRAALCTSLLELVNLGEKHDQLVDSLSRGQKQRLSLARSLIHDPKLLILDEPASGLDPSARVELRMLILELHRQGKTIIISSHILAELEEMCTHVGIIANGRLASSQRTEDIVGTARGGIKMRIVLADGRHSETIVADMEAQRTLLHELMVNQGLPVVEYVPVVTGLEQRFIEAVTNQQLPSTPPQN